MERNLATELFFQFNVLEIVLYTLFIFFCGYCLKRKKILRLRKKVTKLENEMLANHAEILNLK